MGVGKGVGVTSRKSVKGRAAGLTGSETGRVGADLVSPPALLLLPGASKAAAKSWGNARLQKQEASGRGHEDRRHGWWLAGSGPGQAYG